MPNICFTQVAFYSKNKASVLAFKQKLEESVAGKSTQQNYLWVGHAANMLKDLYPDINLSDVDCRGSISKISDCVPLREFHGFQIRIETDWDANIGMWHKILGDFYKDIKLAYFSCEEHFEYFIKWDVDHLMDICDYYIEYNLPTKCGRVDSGSYGFTAMPDALKWLNKHLPFRCTETNDMATLQTEIWKKLTEQGYDDCYCTFLKYHNISPNEFKFYRRKKQ